MNLQGEKFPREGDTAHHGTHKGRPRDVTRTLKNQDEMWGEEVEAKAFPYEGVACAKTWRRKRERERAHV